MLNKEFETYIVPDFVLEEMVKTLLQLAQLAESLDCDIPSTKDVIMLATELICRKNEDKRKQLEHVFTLV